MNKKVGLIIELVLIALYLVLVLFIFDTSTMMGLVFVGIATLVIFPAVLVIEKKREKEPGVEEKPVETGEVAPPMDKVKPETPAQPVEQPKN